MTPEGRQQIERRMAEAEQFCRDWKYEPAARWRSLMKELLESLALLLADALPQVTETKEDTDTRVDPMGNSKDNPTASENETTPSLSFYASLDDWRRHDDPDGGEIIELQFAEGGRVNILTDKPLLFIAPEQH